MKWISIKDQIPRTKMQVLIYTDCEHINIGFHDADGIVTVEDSWYNGYSGPLSGKHGEFTHWSYLYEIPRPQRKGTE